MNKKNASALLFLVLGGCFSKAPVAPAQTVEIHEIAKDFEIPKKFIQAIENDVAAETKILSPVFIYSPLVVLLTEKTSQTLKSHALRFQFPKGGGRIDFSDVVKGQGSFYLSFPAEQFQDLPEIEHLFYVSQAPRKQLEGEEFGLGCGKWVDLKNKFSNLQKADFLNLNTTQLRHLFVTAGHYIFVFRKLNQIYLTQLTLVDSKNENELCPQVKGLSL